jgi:hypothetical protein
MTYLVKPHYAQASKDPIDVIDSPLWDIPGLLGVMRTCAALPQRSAVALTLSDLTIWFETENGVEDFSLEKFCETYPAHVLDLLKVSEHVQASHLSERMDIEHSFTEDGDTPGICVLFTKYGPCSWIENVEWKLDDLLYQLGEEDEPDDETIEDVMEDCGFDAGQICTLFTHNKDSAHEQLRRVQDAAPILDIWTKIMKNLAPDVFKYFTYTP